MDALDVAEKLWQAIEQNDDEKASFLLTNNNLGSDFIKNVCQKEVNKIVFGKEGEFCDKISCFHLAAKRGNDVILTQMLDGSKMIDLDMPSSMLGWSALHYASHGGHKHALKSLLRAGANKSPVAKNGCCPIHVAIRKGFRRIAGYLVAQDCDVNMQDEKGNTPLHYCLDERVLTSTGWTGKQRYEMVELLLIKGAYGALKNAAKDSPLHWAVQYSVEPDTVQILIQAVEHISEGVDILNANNQSPLHLAQDPNTIETLLSYGACVNLAASNGMTPLHHHVNSPEATEILLHHGAKVTLKDRQGRTPLHLAVLNEVPNLWTIELLSSQLESVNMADNNLETALHLACQTMYTNVRTIDDQQCNVLVTFQPGEDPVLEILIRHGANIGLQNKKKQTALLKALEKRLYNKANILYISSRGAYLDVPDQYGRTAKTVAPNWYSNLPLVDSCLGEVTERMAGMKVLEVLEEEEVQGGNGESAGRKMATIQPYSPTDNMQATTASKLVPFPSWIQNDSKGNSKSGLHHTIKKRLPKTLTQLPKWVLEPEEDCPLTLDCEASTSNTYSTLPRWDTVPARAQDDDDTPDHEVTDPEDGVQNLTRQMTSLQGEMKDFTRFLEEFAQEGQGGDTSGDVTGPKTEDLGKNLASLKDDVNNVKRFLEKFSEESDESVPEVEFCKAPFTN